MLRLLGLLSGWQGYAALAAAVFLAGFGGAWKLRDLMADHDRLAAAKAQAGAARHVTAQVLAQDAISASASASHATRAAAIETGARTLAQEIPRHVTPQTDLAYPVPVGAVRVLNAAISGRAVSAVPDPAGRADDAPSGTALSAVVSAVAGNDAACRADAQQLADLQGWITDQMAAARADGR